MGRHGGLDGDPVIPAEVRVTVSLSEETLNALQALTEAYRGLQTDSTPVPAPKPGVQIGQRYRKDSADSDDIEYEYEITGGPFDSDGPTRWDLHVYRSDGRAVSLDHSWLEWMILDDTLISPAPNSELLS